MDATDHSRSIQSTRKGGWWSSNAGGFRKVGLCARAVEQMRSLEKRCSVQKYRSDENKDVPGRIYKAVLVSSFESYSLFLAGLSVRAWHSVTLAQDAGMHPYCVIGASARRARAAGVTYHTSPTTRFFLGVCLHFPTGVDAKAVICILPRARILPSLLLRCSTNVAFTIRPSSDGNVRSCLFFGGVRFERSAPPPLSHQFLLWRRHRLTQQTLAPLYERCVNGRSGSCSRRFGAR